jgi:phage terminase large subunit-like protein
MTKKEIEQLIKQILGTIEREREREIVARRYGLYDRKETLEQIGELLGITRERVRQLEKAVMARLRAHADAGELQGIDQFQKTVIEVLEKSGAEEVSLWMPDSINKLEAALLEKRITVEVNPVMTSCAAGVVYEENKTGHRMFAKNKATTRIDGMVSLAMSIGVATIGPPKNRSSYLENDSLLVL